MFVLLSERVKVKLARLIDEKFTGNFHSVTSSSVGLRIATRKRAHTMLVTARERREGHYGKISLNLSY